VPVGGGDGRCGQGSATGAATVSFADDIHPILRTKGCLSGGCHGGFLPSSSYSLTSYSAMFAPGDEAGALNLCPVVPGDPDASYLLEKLGDNPRSGTQMPLLRDPLSEEEVALIATWIAEGAADN
jgi:hypothetical protein